MKEVTFQVTLTEDEAWAAAERAKRMGFSDYRRNAASDDEAYAMRDADSKLRQALKEAGYAPR